ncbi:protein P54-like [Xenopus laevis]|uniref:Protein P54-like n=1 Tax=Xenopus laevis TaxID=8355 RepID=A0A8J1KXU8_XENLA|nr:protein P54-like [Xenopus laevis]
MDPSPETEESIPVTAEAADILESEQTAKRRIKPSVKRIETYEARKDEINDGLSDLWNKTDHCITVTDETGNTRLQLTDALIRLKTAYSNYKRRAEKYSSFLSNARMKEALQELNAFTIMDHQRLITFLQTTTRLETRIAQLQDNASKASTSSRRSKGPSRALHSVSQKSSLSSQIIRARAEAEAAKVQAQCIKREAALKAHIANTQAEAVRKQAETEAEAARKQAENQAEAARNQAEAEAQLEVLQKEREAAAAIAKLNVLEQAFEEEELEVDRPCLTTPADPVMRTLRFVLDQEVRGTTFPTIVDPAYISPGHRIEDLVFCSREAQTTELANPHTHQTKGSSEPAYATGHTLRDEGETKPTPGSYTRQPSSSPNTKSLSGLNPSAAPFPPPTPKVEVPEVRAHIKRKGLICLNSPNT